MQSFLEDEPVMQSTAVYENVYNPELPFVQLDVSKAVQISVVVDGCGVHKTLNKAAELGKCHNSICIFTQMTVYFAEFVKKPAIALAKCASVMYDNDNNKISV